MTTTDADHNARAIGFAVEPNGGGDVWLTTGKEVRP